VPVPVVIQVDEKTILEQQITFTLAGRSVAARRGLQFGSEVLTGEVWDWPSGSMLGRVRNLKEFAGLLAFGKWTGNADGRQVVFHKEVRERKYTASFIDFGYCFNAGEWSFHDALLRGVYGLNDVYRKIESWDDFGLLASANRDVPRAAAADLCHSSLSRPRPSLQNSCPTLCPLGPLAPFAARQCQARGGSRTSRSCE
jgi:hypothetical protein